MKLLNAVRPILFEVTVVLLLAGLFSYVGHAIHSKLSGPVATPATEVAPAPSTNCELVGTTPEGFKIYKVTDERLIVPSVILVGPNGQAAIR